MIPNKAKWNIRCFCIWHFIISECFLCSAWFGLLNALKRSASAAWIYDRCIMLHWICTMAWQFINNNKIYILQCLFYSVVSYIVVIRFCQPVILLWTWLSSTFSWMAVDPMRSSESLSQMSMCIVWRARYRRNQRFSPGLRKLSSTLNCNCRPGDAEQRMRGDSSERVKTVR